MSDTRVTGSVSVTCVYASAFTHSPAISLSTYNFVSLTGVHRCPHRNLACDVCGNIVVSLTSVCTFVSIQNVFKWGACHSREFAQ